MRIGSAVCLFLLLATVSRGEGSKLHESLFDLRGQAGLPAYLKCDADTRGGSDGLHSGEIRTVSTDLFRHDFVLDVVFELGLGDGERFDGAVGIGENDHDGGWLVNSLECDFNCKGPDKADLNLKFHRHYGDKDVVKLTSAGPHLLRMEKAGDKLTYSIAAGYEGADPDTVKFRETKTVSSFKAETPFLNRLNSSIYLIGKMRWQGVRLKLDGKWVDPGKRADSTAGPDPDSFPFFSFGPTSHVPGFFVKTSDQPATARFTEDGWELESGYKTKEADFLARDFTLDLVVKMPPGERKPMVLGIGENGHDSGNWVLNSVCSRVFGPDGDGKLTCTFHNFDHGESVYGKLGKAHAGPNLIRMQKRGDALMFAAMADFTDKVDLDFMTVCPSLKYQASYLTAKNGTLFLGDHGTIQKMRLIVDGKAVNPNIGVSADKVVASTENPAGDRPVDKKRPGRPPPPPAVRSRPADVPPPPDDRPKLAITGIHHSIATGMNNGLLLLEPTQLRRLGGDGFTVTDTIKLPGNYGWVFERKDCFVAMSDESKSLDVIDKKTLAIRKSIQMDYPRRWDLCCDPGRPISYVTVEKTTDEGFANVILVVDEATGDVREPEDFIGKYLKLSPNGRVLYSAYNQIYKKGDRLLFNPNQIDVIPEYGDIDILIEYDVSEAKPREIAAKDKVGANCQGLALSSDGKRVSFLSFVGYPLYSKNIAAWDPADLEKRPVSYPAQANKADCRHLAFHPSLPIAAAASETGAVCFDRETGAVQKSRVDLPGSFDSTKIVDLAFSPDGTNLILDCEQNDGHFLVKCKLNLSTAEAATARQGPPKPVLPGDPVHRV